MVNESRQAGVFSASEMELARILYETMEHLDPQEGREWESFRVDEKEFFALCIKSLLCYRGLVCSALGDNNLIRRCTEISE